MSNIETFSEVFKQWAMPHANSVIKAFLPKMELNTPKLLLFAGFPEKISLSNEVNVLIEPLVESMFGKINKLTNLIDDEDIPKFAHGVVDNLIAKSKDTGYFELFSIIQIPTDSYVNLKEQLNSNLPLHKKESVKTNMDNEIPIDEV